MAGSKQVDHWTSGTVCECSEIAGFPHQDNSVHKCVYLIIDPKLIFPDPKLMFPHPDLAKYLDPFSDPDPDQ
jgi:hypothetical protein